MKRKFIRTIFCCEPVRPLWSKVTNTWGADVKKWLKRRDPTTLVTSLPLSSDQPSGTLDPLQGGWPTLGFHRSPMLPTMWGLSRVSRAEKDSISGLLLALSDLSKWLGWDIWLGKTRGKMFVKSGPGPILHVVGYSFGQYSWLMRERWWFAQLVHFVGSDLFDMT